MFPRAACILLTTSCRKSLQTSLLPPYSHFFSQSYPPHSYFLHGFFDTCRRHAPPVFHPTHPKAESTSCTAHMLVLRSPCPLSQTSDRSTIERQYPRHPAVFPFTAFISDFNKTIHSFYQSNKLTTGVLSLFMHLTIFTRLDFGFFAAQS